MRPIFNTIVSYFNVIVHLIFFLLNDYDGLDGFTITRELRMFEENNT